MAIGVGKKKRTYESSPTFRFRSIEITCDEKFKLLGVDIDFKLSFENDISNLCKKAAKQLNVLKRMGKKPQQTKQTVYISYIYLIPF